MTTASAPQSAPAASAGRARLRGVDVARALAILGMLIVHVGPTGGPDDGDALGWVYRTVHGKAATLFVVVAGVGIGLASGHAKGAAWGPRGRLVWRAALLLPLGLVLQGADHGVAVILHYYAVWFLVGAVLLTAADRVLLAVAGSALALGPVALIVGHRTALDAFGQPTSPSFSQPLAVARNLLLTGTYPTVTWLLPLLFGMWLGRRDLRAAGSRLAVAGAAAAAAAYGLSALLSDLPGSEIGDRASWWHLLDAGPHQNMPLGLVGATAAGAGVLGLCLAVAGRWPRPGWPLAAAGECALSIYVGHLLLLALRPGLLDRETVGEALVTVTAFWVLAGCAAVAWRALLPSGPLESVMAAPRALSRMRGLGHRRSRRVTSRTSCTPSTQATPR